MRKIVLDTNCLLASISSRSDFFDVWRGLHGGCIVSNDRHFNILSSIDFPKINVLKIQAFLALLRQSAT